MGKIYDGLSKGIMAAMKNKDSVRTQALKNIKAKMIEFKPSNEGVKVCAVDDATGERIIPDSSEIAIVKKMAKELEGDIEVRNSIIKSLDGTDDVALNVTSVNAMALNVTNNDVLILDGTFSPPFLTTTSNDQLTNSYNDTLPLIKYVFSSIPLMLFILVCIIISLSQLRLV